METTDKNSGYLLTVARFPQTLSSVFWLVPICARVISIRYLLDSLGKVGALGLLPKRLCKGHS